MGCREMEKTIKGYRVSFWGDENVLNLILAMIAQVREKPLNHMLLIVWYVNYSSVKPL